MPAARPGASRSHRALPDRARARARRSGRRLPRRGHAPRRKVALKVLTGSVARSRRVARFLREAEVASRLDHPGIATVYEIGTEAGFPFIAMRYVEGETLAARIGRGSERRCRTGCGEEDVAHRRRRRRGRSTPRTRPASSTATSSPGNIMITAGRRSGHPRLRSRARRRRRARHARRGPATSSARPPTCRRSRSRRRPLRLDRRTDVWSLGVDALRVPHASAAVRGPDPRGALPGGAGDGAARSQEAQPAIPEDLESSSRRRSRRSVDRRYETAGAMADDLAAFVERPARRRSPDRRAGPASGGGRGASPRRPPCCSSRSSRSRSLPCC